MSTETTKFKNIGIKITSLSDPVALPDIGGHTAEDNTKLIEIYEKDIADLDK